MHKVLMAALGIGSFVLVGCDRREEIVPPAPAVQAPPLAPTSDASVPSASSVLGAASAPAARDDGVTDPKAALPKAVEDAGMPAAGHGNNHSSPALGTSASGASN